MARYLKTAIRLSLFIFTLMPSIGTGERLQPTDLVYVGAFRLPDDFNWGARGISYYPAGNSGAGSLLVTGFEALTDGYAEYGEVSIPTPQQEANWENLPTATFLRPMTPFDGGLVQELEGDSVFVSGIQYVPRQGTQVEDKIYGSLNEWYPEGDFGDDSFPTIWLSNLNGSSPRGLFYVGPQPQSAPYHGRKMGEYLFTVPQWYADLYLGGRTLVTGRSRGTPAGDYEGSTTQGGSQGPTLFAIQPWQVDSPAANASMNALPILYYRAAYPGCAGPDIGVGGQAVDCDYQFSDQVFRMCDAWSGAGFVESGSKRAILIIGQKSSTNCYYCGPEYDPECPVAPPPAECTTLWCNESRGYHCGPYERQVIFYDVDALGVNVLSATPWTVLPYTLWRPAPFYLQGYTCGDMGGMAVDPTGGRVFMVERGLGEGDINAAVVHVWTVGSSCPPCSGSVVTLNAPFPAGTTCECVATTSITIGSGVVIPSGATVTFRAPLVTIQPGVTIHQGAVVNIRQ